MFYKSHCQLIDRALVVIIVRFWSVWTYCAQQLSCESVFFVLLVGLNCHDTFYEVNLCLNKSFSLLLSPEILFS